MRNVDCRKLPETIAEVLGGEAAPGLEEALDRHILTCPACARSRAGLAEILERARAARVPEPPAGYWEAFLPELRRRISPGDARRSPFGRARRPLGRWLPPALAAALLAGLVVAGLAPGGGPRVPSPEAARGAGPGRTASSFPAGGSSRPPAGNSSPAAAPASLAELQRTLGLLQAIDPLIEDEPLPAYEEAGVEDDLEPAVSSADLFGFFDAGGPLTPEQKGRILAALADEFAG